MTPEPETAPWLTKRVVVCLGPGGVGKTSVSATLGVAGALAGRRVAVLTIDPARRLADAIGMRDALGHEPVRVPGDWDGELWGCMLDPSAVFADIVTSTARNEQQASEILGNRLYRSLVDDLTGTQEYMAAERLHQLVQDDRFDLVVLDTPPARHALDFLDAPARLQRFLDHPLYRYTLAVPGSGGITPQASLRRASYLARRLALKAVAQIIGNHLLDEVASLMAAFEGMDDGFRNRAVQTAAILADDATGYMLIATPKAEALEAARWMQRELAERRLTVDTLVTNRMFPAFLAESYRTGAGALDRNLRELGEVAKDERARVDGLADELGIAHHIRLSEQPTPVDDLPGLRKLSLGLG